ncbi:unnamed protein product [Trichogramma brassicae]|uniref:Integrase catalytic domain-containing protein n=1 Tax=Trichogramma brassicae TaxID=86971 RepID=A0A6H5I012_9HYME|nr:unnamed protein product [Trichogramma brassicae]
MCVNFRVDGGDNLVPFIVEKRSHPPIMIVRQLFDDEPTAVADRTSEFATRIFTYRAQRTRGRLTRWMLAIQDYDLHMTYVRGKDNGLADALSRLPGHRPDDGHELSIASIAIRAPSHRIVMRLKNIITEQKKDEKCVLIADRLRSGLEVGDYACRDGILIKGKVGSQKIVIPRTLAYEVMLEIHEFYVHVGGKKVLQTFRESFYAEKARHIATNITRACDSCQRNKTYNRGNFVGVRAIIQKGPHDLLSVDYMGPYPTSISGARYILVCVDAFSKFVQLYPIRRADAPTTIRRIFNDYLPKYGPAKRIQTDHGTQFTSILWKRALRESNITHVLSSIRHPQSNIVERVNKEIGRMLRTLISKSHKAWATLLPRIQDCLNEVYHESTECTPMEIHLGKRPTRFWENYINIPTEINKKLVKNDLMLVAERIRNKREKYAMRENARHKIVNYRVGDRVLVRNEKLSKANTHVISKFLALYEGPYIITKIYSGVTFELINETTGKPSKSQLRRLRKKATRNRHRMKKKDRVEMLKKLYHGQKSHSGPIARARRALEKEQGHRVEEPVSHVETSRAVTEAQIRARRRLKATEEEHLREQRRNQDIKKEYTRQWIARSFGTLDLKLPEGDIKRSTFPMCRIPADDVLQIHYTECEKRVIRATDDTRLARRTRGGNTTRGGPVDRRQKQQRRRFSLTVLMLRRYCNNYYHTRVRARGQRKETKVVTGSRAGCVRGRNWSCFHLNLRGNDKQRDNSKVPAADPKWNSKITYATHGGVPNIMSTRIISTIAREEEHQRRQQKINIMSIEDLKELYNRLFILARDHEYFNKPVRPLPDLDLEKIRAKIDWFLYRAVLHRHIEVVKFLPKLGIKEVSGAEPGKTAARTAIHRAARQGQWDMARALFDVYDRRNYQEPRTDLTHLHVACITASLRHVWQYLDQKDCNVDAPCQTYAESYPLNLAVYYYLRAYEERERAIQEAAREGRQPPVEDATENPLATIEVLLKAGANANRPNRDGTSLLTRAIRANRGELVALLLRHKADPNHRDAETGRWPLDEALGLNDRQAIAYIMGQPRDPNHLRAQERRDLLPAVHRYAELVAADRLSLDAYQELVGCDEDSLPRVLEKLIFGTTDRRERQREFYAKMLEYGADPNALCATGRMPRLDKPATTRIVEALLRAGAKATNCDPQGRTPLRRTIAYNYYSLVEKLLLWDGLADQESRDGVTPLEEAARCLDTEAVELLVLHGAAATTLNADRRRRAWVTAAVRENRVELIRHLIEHGFEPSSPDQLGRTLLDEAMIYDRPGLLRMLLEKGHRPRFDAEDDSRNPLVVAVRHQYTEIARVLLEEADAEAKILDKPELRGLLTRLVANDKLELLELLIKAGTSTDAKDTYDATLLHKAVQLKKPEAIGLLLRNRADPNLRCVIADYRTPLLQAVVDRDAAIVRRLLDEARNMGIIVNTKRRDMDDKVAIERAVENFDLATLRVLLEHGAEIETFNSPDNREILTQLIERDQLEIVRTLILAGVDPNVQSLRSNSLQHEAVAKVRPEILEWLLAEGGALPSLPNGIGVPPLHLACQTNQTELALVLLRHGADTTGLSLRDDPYDRIVLHQLIKDDNRVLIEALLKEGVNPNEPTALLHVCLGMGDQEAMIEVLLQNGADPGRPEPETGLLPRDRAESLNRPKAKRLLDAAMLRQYCKQ